jgi:hypothetical protein
VLGVGLDRPAWPLAAGLALGLPDDLGRGAALPLALINISEPTRQALIG